MIEFSKWANIKGTKEFLWPTLFLFTAFVLAVFSLTARGNDQHYTAAFLAMVSLICAFIVSVTLVPRLLAHVQLDFLYKLQLFRFTQRGAFFILIVLIILFATFNTGNNLLILVLSFLMASLFVSGIIANLVLFGLKISLGTPDSIHAGQRAVFLVTLHNLKRFFPSFALNLKGAEGDSEGSEHTDFFVRETSFPYVRAGERLRLRLQCEFGRRGIYPVQGFKVRTTFPFGFFWRGRNLDASGNIFVYPQLYDLGPLFFRYPELRGMEQPDRRGLGSELYKIRHYQTGDSARFVHWKSTAKLARLMVKDFSREESIPLNLCLSTYLPDLSKSSLKQFERAVSYLASLGYYYRSKGYEFSFSSGEFQAMVNGQGSEYEKLMRFLAKVEPTDEVSFDENKIPAPCILFSAGDQGARQDTLQVDYLKL